MPYEPIPGGYNWQDKVAAARRLTRRQRELIQLIVKGECSQAELYQALTAIVLTNSQLDDVLNELANFRSQK